MKSIVITGVSSGIGYGAAGEFARHGYRVFGSVRREEDAARLEAELGSNFVPLLIDVTDREAVLEAAGRVEEIVGDDGLAGLVNNAGIAVAGPLMHQPIEEMRAHFEVNVLGLVSVTQAFLPLLGARKPRTHPPGRIVNVSSIGGRVALPFIGAYAGTKHAVEGISDSLRRELLLYGIEVIVVGPGAVRTPMWKKGAAQADRYSRTDYAAPAAKFAKYADGLAENGYPPEKFGSFIREAFEAEKPKTRYSIVPRRFTSWIVPAALPDRWLDRLVGRNFGLT